MVKRVTLPPVPVAKHKSFGRELNFMIEQGYEQTKKLQQYFYEFYTGANSDISTKRNWYISSFPGAGKTFTGKKVAEHLKVNPIRFGGNTTMFGLAMRIVYEAYWSKEEVIPIWIDDCDSLFTGDDNLNTMKELLDTSDPQLKWTKAVPKGFLADKEDLQQALSSFEVPGIGFQIDAEQFSRFRFLVTSNHVLTTTQDIRSGKVRKTRQADGESAIYSRTQVKNFALKPEENWGWLASIVLPMPHFESINGKTFTITAEQKYELLTWLHAHWSDVGDPSMRTVGQMASSMKANPEGYLDDWEDLLR